MSQVGVDNVLLHYISLYYELGETEKANHLANELATNNYQMLKYINSLSPKFANTPSIQQEENISLRVIQMLLGITSQAGQKDLALEIKNKVESLFNPGLLQPLPPVPRMQDSAKEVEM